MTLPLTIGLALLLGWNLHLALANKTTIEYHEGVTARVRVRGMRRAADAPPLRGPAELCKLERLSQAQAHLLKKTRCLC